ncbi:auxin response factor 3 isoform X2 [Silene latifolia]|uniref:auxin response factor 3 isoform X2 n=1 Tax=Silene latifolia TaxID=37657 RepID=UPI003D76C5AC
MMGVLIDLNTTNNEEEEDLNNFQSTKDSNFSVSSSSNFSSPISVCMDLWHACAGPLISLPKKGSFVVYLPQGHLDEQHNMSDFHNNNNNNYNNNNNNNNSNNNNINIPPHVFCRVIDVKLHAEVATDEVYAQVSLIPESQIEEKLRDSESDVDGEEEDFEDAIKSSTPHMFCKTLTASDTSTHGGFSVPRRAAEDCFPPLDYKQQRPSQELVAKDLHGLEWRFRHIYRGQPRRHLLTTGWSAFVNKKKLVSGDAVLFLRGADGELRLGIRRAVQLKGCAAYPSLLTGPMSKNGLTAAFEAISARRAFNVCYNPRASSSEFIVPLRRFMKSVNSSFSVGTRFKMRFEAEDAGERRYTGVVTGLAELDPVRWPGSKWRSLMVRWDDVEVNRHGRVSPWEIEPTGSFPSPSHLMTSGLKRSRIGLPVTKPDFPIPGGTGGSDFGESLGFRKVLQGQEKWGSHSAHDGNDNPHHSISDPRRYFPSGIPPDDYAMSSKGVGFGESYRFQKVLQGQETHLNPASMNRRHENFPTQVFEGVQVSNYGNGNSWLKAASSIDSLTQASSPSSVLMFQQSSIPPRSFPSPLHQQRMMNMEHMSYPSVHAYNSPLNRTDEAIPRGKTSCRLFGFSLTEGEHRVDPERQLGSFPVLPPVYPETRFWPLVEGQPCYKSPSVTKAPAGNDLYSVRDMLLDIAL